MLARSAICAALHRTVPVCSSSRSAAASRSRTIRLLGMIALAASQIPSGFLGQKYFGVTAICKEGTRRSIVGGGGHAGRQGAFPTAWIAAARDGEHPARSGTVGGARQVMAGKAQ